MNNSHRIIATAVVLLTLGPSVARAASPDLLTPMSDKAIADIPKAQAQRLEVIKRRPTTSSVSVMRLDVGALEGESTRIALSKADAVVLSGKKIDVVGRANFTWVGSLPGIPGAATLVVHDGRVTGTVRSGERLFRIEPIGNTGTHALIEVDAKRLPPEEPPAFEERVKKGLRGFGLERPFKLATGPINYDVLVAYTGAARAAVSDIAATIRLAVAETNQAYQNSDVNVRVTLVDTLEVTYQESGKTYETIVDDFSGMTAVTQLRDSSGADVAVLLVDQADYCGMATGIGVAADEAFAAVYYDCATGYYSFAHEIGHLQGARHDPANDSSSGACHGLQHPSTDAAHAWRTIMSYACTGTSCNPRIQYFSNPDVSYDGTPTGTATGNDNAGCLDASAAKVAGFRNRPAQLCSPACVGPRRCVDGKCKCRKTCTRCCESEEGCCTICKPPSGICP